MVTKSTKLITMVVAAAVYWLAAAFPGENFLGDRWAALVGDEVGVTLLALCAITAVALVVDALSSTRIGGWFLRPALPLAMMVVGWVPVYTGTLVGIGIAGAALYVGSMWREGVRPPSV